MNIKVLEEYNKTCKELDLEPSFKGLKLFFYIYNKYNKGGEYYGEDRN